MFVKKNMKSKGGKIFRIENEVLKVKKTRISISFSYTRVLAVDILNVFCNL